MHANRRRCPVSLLYTTRGAETVLALDVASPLLTPATRAMLAHYPGVGITGGEQSDKQGDEKLVAYLRLAPDVRSIQTVTDFEDRLQRALTDPVSGLLDAVAERNDGMRASIKLSLEQVSARQRRRARRVAGLLNGPLAQRFPAIVDILAMRANGSIWERLSVLPLVWFSRGEATSESSSKLDDHLYQVTIKLWVESQRGRSRLAQKRLDALAAAFAPFTIPGAATFRRSRRPVRSLLSGAELAALWHFQVDTESGSSLQSAPLPHLPAPASISDFSREEGTLPLGMLVDGPRRSVGVRTGDRLHQLIVGKSGMGKSTLIHTQVAADVVSRGVGVVDPHGDLIDDVLTTIPRHRTNDVVILDPADPGSPTINPLACHDPAHRVLVAENNLAALSKVFGFDQQTTPRLLHILRYTLLALVGTNHGSYLSIRPMLTDKQFRKRVVDLVEDAEVRSFWVDEVGRWSERYEQEAMPAILNKTGQFTAHQQLRRMFGDPQGDIDLRDLMDEGKIVLVNLSQGKLGEPAARFAGAVLMTGFQNAAMTRADTHRSQRRPFYLYADEYATFVNSSFADTLAQARKYGLFLTAAQQVVSQVDEQIMDAVFGNLATLVVFQVAQKDSERLAAELTGGCQPTDLMRLPKYHAVVRTAIDGVPSRPFVVKTLPPPQARQRHAKSETIRRVAARRYVRQPPRTEPSRVK